MRLRNIIMGVYVGYCVLSGEMVNNGEVQGRGEVMGRVRLGDM